MPALLTDKYVVAVGIPLILLFSGAAARKLVRGTPWQTEDFFLGVQFTLAAMSSALIHIVDVLRKQAGNPVPASVAAPDRLIGGMTFLAVTFMLLLVVMSTHQDWNGRIESPRLRAFWLGAVANLIGAGLIAAFVLFVKEL